MAPSVPARVRVAEGAGAKAASLVAPDSAATIKRLTDSLRKMGDKPPRPRRSGTGVSKDSLLP